MKFILNIFYFLIITLFSLINVNAEGERYFTIDTQKLTQNVINNEVAIKLHINAEIDVDKLEISITYPKDTLKLQNSKNTLFTSVKKGQNKESEFVFLPLKSGESKIQFKVQAWRNEANYVELSDEYLIFDKDLVSLPISDEYNSNLQIYNIFKIILIVVVIIGVIVGLYLGYKRFVKWYNTDD